MLRTDGSWGSALMIRFHTSAHSVKITKEDLETVAPVIVDSHVLGEIKENEKVLSPGMKYKHYAPDSKCLLIYSKDNNKLCGYTETMKLVNVDCDSEYVGKIVDVLITDVKTWSMEGVIK